MGVVSIKADFSDVDATFASFQRQVEAEMRIAGEKAVEANIEHGNYKNRTGLLRSSNKYEVESDGLVIENTAPYASFVQAKGFSVIDEGILAAVGYLQNKFE